MRKNLLRLPFPRFPPPCNLLCRRVIQSLAMTPPGLGVATLHHEQTGRSDSDTVDATLAASGDAHAFARLYRGHVARIHSLVAWQKLGTFRGESAFGTWLHRLAVNVILGRRQTLGIRRQRFLEGDAVLETVPSRRPTPELSMDFEVAIGRLPEGARQVFVLHDIEGYRHEEIGEMLGLATGTSKSQLHRARMALRQHLER
jgi:RNA polymerase sigma-70 factor (ECF subfamily)